MDWSLLTQFVNSSKIAGWTRAIVASGLSVALAKWPLLREYLDPTTQAALCAFATGIAVAVWSHFAKTLDGPSKPVALGEPTAKK